MMNIRSEVFRAQQRPDEIGQHEGGSGTAENKIEHGSNLSAKCDETNQRGEDHRCVDNRNDVAHGETSLEKKGSGSFLKKRTKKLLFRSMEHASANADRAPVIVLMARGLRQQPQKPSHTDNDENEVQHDQDVLKVRTPH
jgi:hypothetical protein